MTKNILIIGGYGNAGSCIAMLLMQETDARIFLGGRSLEKAKYVAEGLNRLENIQRVEGVRLNVEDPQSLKEAFSGMDIVVVASNTPEYARQIAVAALEAKVDYIDIQYSDRKLHQLKLLSQKINNANLCFITEAGSLPGLPSALVHLVHQDFTTLERVSVGAIICQNWKSAISEERTNEVMRQLSDYQPYVYKNYHWKRLGWFHPGTSRTFNFGSFGRLSCGPMTLEEMRPLPGMYTTLKELGFYMGGFNWFTNWISIPLLNLGLRFFGKEAKRSLGKLLVWGLRNFDNQPYGMAIKVSARGERGGIRERQDILLSHKDAYMFTAIPLVACLKQYLDGFARRSGLYYMGHLVDSKRLVGDMEKMGMTIRFQTQLVDKPPVARPRIED